MSTHLTTTGTAEWRAHGVLPVVAALGYATSVIHIYGLGPYIQPISESFGWDRADTTLGLLISTLIQAVMAVPIGMLVDRIGSRRLALFGVMTTCAAVALLGTATGSFSNWVMLWLVIAFASLPVQATIWMSAVASRFQAARGMALAVTLCGASVAQFLFPVIGNHLIEAFGWQKAFAIHAIGWAALLLPILYLFFRGAKDAPAPTQLSASSDVESGMSLKQGLASPVFLRLLVVSLCLTFAMVGLNVHFFPLLTGAGVAKANAAYIVGLIGIFSLIGRLSTGYLLDRYSASKIGAGMFMLPAIGIGLLLFDPSQTNAVLASALFGLALGSEIDVIAYLTTRHFGLKNFGSLYGGILAALSIGTAIGPYIASRIFDATRNYDLFLQMGLAGMILSSLLALSLPQPPQLDSAPE